MLTTVLIGRRTRLTNLSAFTNSSCELGRSTSAFCGLIALGWTTLTRASSVYEKNSVWTMAASRPFAALGIVSERKLRIVRRSSHDWSFGYPGSARHCFGCAPGRCWNLSYGPKADGMKPRFERRRRASRRRREVRSFDQQLHTRLIQTSISAHFACSSPCFRRERLHFLSRLPCDMRNASSPHPRNSTALEFVSRARSRLQASEMRRSSALCTFLVHRRNAHNSQQCAIAQRALDRASPESVSTNERSIELLRKAFRPNDRSIRHLGIAFRPNERSIALLSNALSHNERPIRHLGMAFRPNDRSIALLGKAFRPNDRSIRHPGIAFRPND